MLVGARTHMPLQTIAKVVQANGPHQGGHIIATCKVACKPESALYFLRHHCWPLQIKFESNHVACIYL
jgi:hypothetical protein